MPAPTDKLVRRAAARFSRIPAENLAIEVLGDGLINHTYQVSGSFDGSSFVLQAINSTVFNQPYDILYNYALVQQHLTKQDNAVNIPAMVLTRDGRGMWVDLERNYWRATNYLPNSFSKRTVASDHLAYSVAKCFGNFTASLSSMDSDALRTVIPNFHDLKDRFIEFEKAVKSAQAQNLKKSAYIISELRNRRKLVDFFDLVQRAPGFRSRVMHHDCKVTNVLFDRQTDDAICPVDLDTVMPGKFFSDLGDMIRSMVCEEDENSTNWQSIRVRPDFYRAILNGYLEETNKIFTTDELNHIHYAGLFLIFMQSIRFLTDFLSGDLYYKTNYKEQNCDRAFNQLILLQDLERVLKELYSFDPYSL
ncbi:MAG TPA: phosphotransferase [Puia sp.]|nr:phosphotransferase [Puia sp.]